MSEVDQILNQWAPEYSEFWSRNSQHFIEELRLTLNYWMRKFRTNIQKDERNSYSTKSNIKNKEKKLLLLRNLKIIEIVAFWVGFYNNSSYFVPKTSNLAIPGTKIIPSKNKGEKISVIIPIGTIKSDYMQVLHSSLQVLIKNPLIFRIYCIADGVILPARTQDFLSSLKKIHFISFPNRNGPAIIRNHGIQLSKNEGVSDIILLDADIVLEEKSFQNLLIEYISSPYSILFPRIVSTDTSIFSYYYDINGILNGRTFGSLKFENPKRYSSLLYGTTSVVFLNQSVFSNGVRFDESYPFAAGEDIDFSLNLLHAGVHLVCFNEGNIKHYYGNHQSSECALNTFKARFERYGKGNSLLIKKHPYFFYWLNQTQEN